MPATVFGEPDSEPEPEAQYETLDIDPGTTITGFYAGQVSIVWSLKYGDDVF